MREVMIDKLVISIGTSSDEKRQANAKQLLTIMTGRKPTDALAKRRIPTFNISKNSKIGTFVTIRGRNSLELIKKLLEAVNNRIKESSVTNNTVNFGVREYIDIRGVKYDPKIGMMGMNVNIVFNRKGSRVAERRRARSMVARSHKRVTREEIGEYLKKEFNTVIEA
jgi:large subunit ribosomal protein L5